MFIVLEDTILNMDHVSRIFIETRGIGGPRVMAEYAPPITRREKDNSSLKEFQIELYRGSEETCKEFLVGLDTMLNSDRKSVTIRSILRQFTYPS